MAAARRRGAGASLPGFLLAWAALLPLRPCAAGDDGLGPLGRGGHNNEKQIAHCVIDVVQASLMLGDAGTAINSAVTGCRSEGGAAAGGAPRRKAKCGAPVVAIIEFLSYTASFLAGASSQCAEAMNMTGLFTQLGFEEILATVAEQEKCATAITQLIAGFGQLSAAATAMASDCAADDFSSELAPGPRHHLLQGEGAAGENGTHDAARLPAAGAGLPGAVASRKQDEAECAFDIGQATLFLARAGGAINGAVNDCSDASLFHRDRAYRADCAVAISGVISSFSYAASTISFAVSECPLVTDSSKHALCAGSIFKLISSLSAIAHAGATFESTCYSQIHPPPGAAADEVRVV